MNITEIDFIKNKIKEIKEDYKKRYKDIFYEIYDIEIEDPISSLQYDIFDRFEYYNKNDKFQICLSLKNINTGEFFNKFFDCSALMPKKEATAPLDYIIYKLNELEDYEIFIGCNFFKGCKNPRRIKENVIASRYLYVDIDNVKGSENLDINSDDYNKQLLELFYKNYEIARYIKPTKILGSGSGLHLYFYLDNIIYFDNKLREEYTKTLRRLAINFEGDLNCVDVSRILRLPYTFNKKSKFEKPKRVELLQYNYIHFSFDEEIRVEYTLIDLNKRLDQYEREHLPSTKDNDFWIEYTLQEGEELPFTEDIINKPINNKSCKKFINKRKKFDDFFCLSNYEINENFPNQYLIQDLLFYIKNRDGYCMGRRRNLLFIFYFCFKQYIQMSYNQSCEYVHKINQLFKKPLPNYEVEELLFYLKNYNLRKGFRNIKVAELLKFNKEEIIHMRGTYSNNQEEKRKIKLERDRRIIKNKYIKTKPNRNIIIDYIINNPHKTNKEYSDILNISIRTVQRIKKTLK